MEVYFIPITLHSFHYNNKGYFIFVINKSIPLIKSLIFITIVTSENINKMYYLHYKARMIFIHEYQRHLFLISVLEEFLSLW
ncbi:Uncharacterised protein [Salmonella bongori]|nr:Uncharacterised protein [Salmonella bongori]